jgi:hypothetical protein
MEVPNACLKLQSDAYAVQENRTTGVIGMSAYVVGALGQGGVLSPQTLAITSVHVVDVAATDPSRAVNPDQTVIVRDGRIIALGNSKLIGVPAEAQRVSGAGKYLIPGLWDMHAHLLGANKRDSFLPLYVVKGVTSVRDMHTVMPMHEVNRWRQDIAAGADPASCRRRCRPADCRSGLSVWASHRN